jgi:hypothetical protein
MTSSIKEGIYAYVGGTVARIFDTKNGPAFNLEIQREGSQYPDRVTVWGAADGLNVGDRVKVQGWLSWRREVKDDKTYFNVSLNKPEVTDHEAAQPVEQQWAEEPPAPEPWDTVQPPEYDGGVPF